MLKYSTIADDWLQADLMQHFAEFASWQIYSTDIDPVYPVLKHYYKSAGLDHDQQVWYTFLYQSCYHLGSGELLWRQFPKPTYPGRLPAMKTGTERRGLRGDTGKLAEHIRSIVDYIKDEEFLPTPYYWVVDSAGIMERAYDMKAGWQRLRTAVEQIKHNGKWASYKFADLMLNVMDLPIQAADIGVGGMGETAGPIPGMVRLTNWDWKRCAEDIEAQELLLITSRQMGAGFQGLDQMETSLCDYNSLSKGSYYIGHDVDAMMEQLLPDSVLWESRKAVIPHEFLGELNGWVGVRHDLKTLYRDHKVLDWWTND